MGAEASLGAIVRAKGGELLEKFPINAAQRKVMRAMADCRSAALGGHRDSCDSCGFEHIFWNSCRDRHCPGCGGEAREQWLEARRDEVLDVPYFHVVFTIPTILNVLALYAPEVVYAILLRAAGQALLDLGASRLRARMGVLTVLHTWGQTLVFHPHIHCVVPGGGFSLDGRRWARVRKISFLFAVKALSRRFRTLFCNAVRDAYADGSLHIPAEIVAHAQALDLLIARSFKTDWHAYAKPPFGGPEHVLAYLSNYTHRIAISNRRILSFDGKTVTFSWRDYADDNAQRTMELDAVEFLRRFLQHVLPPRFTRVRYYGFLANRDRAANIARARELIGSKRPLRPRPHIPDPRLCPQCRKGTMRPMAPVDPQCDRTWFDTS
jgi:hypothetical protein